MSLTREQLVQPIVDAGHFLYGRGWSPATSSNYSTRLSPSEALRQIEPFKFLFECEFKSRSVMNRQG